MNIRSNIYRAAEGLVNIKESGVSHVRAIQDMTTGIPPKLFLARSAGEFVENGINETAEIGLVYYMQGLLAKAFKPLLAKNTAKESLTTPAREILESANPDKNLISKKGALAIACLGVPVAEYSLCFLKNLFTLKVFKQGDFNKLANLDKSGKVDEKHNEKVKNSAISHLKKAGIVYTGILGLAALVAHKGNKGILNHISEAVLAPGTKFFKKNEKLKNFFNDYFGLDFAKNIKGEFKISKGQVTACVLTAFAGYTAAAKDRGKQNYLEVLTRFPIVGLYAITGGDFFDKAFKKIFKNNEKFKAIINPETSNFRTLKELKELPNYKELRNAKIVSSLAPMATGMVVMGFFLTKVTNLFTKMRYNKEKQQLSQDVFKKNVVFNGDVFKSFQ